MVLTKKEMVKQFDLIVKQEIINHNKQLEATNQALNGIQNSIKNLAQKHAEQIVFNEVQFREIRDRTKNIDKKIICFEEKHFVLSDNTENKIKDLNCSLSNRIDYCEVNHVEEFQFKETLNELTDSIHEFERQIDTQKFYLQSEIYNLNTQCEKWISDFRKEINERPSQSLKMQKDLEKKIQSAVVDATGVLKEIEVLKKETFTSVKKIENLYTLVSRVNKRLDSCPKPD